MGMKTTRDEFREERSIAKHFRRGLENAERVAIRDAEACELRVEKAQKRLDNHDDAYGIGEEVRKMERAQAILRDLGEEIPMEEEQEGLPHTTWDAANDARRLRQEAEELHQEVAAWRSAHPAPASVPPMEFRGNEQRLRKEQMLRDGKDQPQAHFP